MEESILVVVGFLVLAILVFGSEQPKAPRTQSTFDLLMLQKASERR